MMTQGDLSRYNNLEDNKARSVIIWPMFSDTEDTAVEMSTPLHVIVVALYIAYNQYW